MSPAFTPRRHADAFDRLVEAARQGIPASEPAPADLADLASFASSLRAAPAVAPRPEFSADLRERLMAAAATELVAAEGVDDRLTVRTHPTARRRHERRLTVGIASLAIVGASAGTALASQGSLPGEPLYPVKRAIENVRTGFTTSDQGKGAALLGDADSRLNEVAELSRGSSDDVTEITRTLDTFSEQAKKASDLLLSNYQQHNDPASIAKLQQFTADSIDQLTVLEPLLPDSAKQALTNAAQAVLMIDSAAHSACPSCGGSPITSLPETLLNPVAKTIDTLTQSFGSKPATPAKGKEPVIKLPTVPTSLGPANVAPPTQPPTELSKKTQDITKQTSVKPVLPPKPTATPTDLGGVVQGTVDGVTGTVDGVLGGVDGLVGGLLTPTK